MLLSRICLFLSLFVCPLVAYADIPLDESLENTLAESLDVPTTNYAPVYTLTDERKINNYDFTLYERGTDEGLKIFILGGIQGDEPGGFNAASLLTTHYTFENAKVYIVPNLNFESIVKRARQVSGDMNRKFADLSTKDPQYDEVKRLQSLILEAKPDIIINLHDGSGFYRKKYISKLRNPNRWGQTCIIDQAEIDSPYGNLEEVATELTQLANTTISHEDNYFEVRNTHTDKGNAEMEKTLTWFGVRNNIASYGFEVSKEFNTVNRVLYHLTQLEAFFDVYGINYDRNFTLTPDDVEKALKCQVIVKMADGRVSLPLQDMKNNQMGYIPLPKNFTTVAPLPIIIPIKKDNLVTMHYGNNIMTKFRTQVYEFSDENPEFDVLIDGIESKAKVGDLVKVESSFLLEHLSGYRINAIGAKKEILQGEIKTEAGVKLTKNDFDSRYALDKSNTIFRVEVYYKKEFVGMLLVEFTK